MSKRKVKFLTKEQIMKIIKEYGTLKTPDELAKELGVSKETIKRVAVRLRKQGIKIPRLQGGKYKEIAEELKKVNPETSS